jgi:hypothetical protein
MHLKSTSVVFSQIENDNATFENFITHTSSNDETCSLV